jgi:transposase
MGGVSIRAHGSRKLLEERRQRVVTSLKQKLSLHERARRIGCRASSVMRWRNAIQSGGVNGLKAKPASSRPPRLTPKQKNGLVRLLVQGARAHGYRTEL